MSLHKSLKIVSHSKKRTVRKRRERLDKLYGTLLRKGGLTDEQIKIYGLPKEKILKLKTKKTEKKEEKKEISLT